MTRHALAAITCLGLFLFGSVADSEARRRRGGAELREDRKEDERAAEAQKHFGFGYRFYQQGLLAKALEELETALRIQPEFPDALYVLGLVHLELNDHSSAIAMFERCLEVNPYFTEAHNLLGTVHAKMGNRQAALREFDAVKADVNFPTPEVAHYNIGKVFVDGGDCGEAVIHFRRALEINPKYGWAWFLLGDCQQALGQLGASRHSLESAVAELGDLCAPHYRLGYVCMLLEDYACARQHFDHVRLTCPSSQEAQGAREFIRQIDFR